MSQQSLSKRVRLGNKAEVNRGGDYVLYWMITCRRPHYNHALDRAVAWSKELGKPLLVFEQVISNYPWASDRLHRFILQGMRDNAAAFAASKVAYYPYVEEKAGDIDGLLVSLAAQAAVVVADDYPAFFVPQMVADMAPQCAARIELVDSNGLYPMRATDKSFPSAYAFRRHLQKELPPFLLSLPAKSLPKFAHLQGAKVPSAVRKRWPAASEEVLAATPEVLGRLAIDHKVGPGTAEGGFVAGRKRLKTFLTERLPRYAAERNHPDLAAQSQLSPYLHFNHISPYEIFDRLQELEGWSIDRIAERANGSREGFWHMSAPAESFLDEFVTWRELGQNTCVTRPHDYDRYESLPPWALETLSAHASDPRDKIYTHAQLERAETYDPIWNAAQRELASTGSLHNYLRMLWGKRIIAWTKRPEDALPIMIDLNNKYGIDGRDPNSYAGIMWCFGRYDRPWPEHDIFGKVRLMTSASTQRKLKMKQYLAEFGDR